ncbi:hypothetical protein X551_03493 [Methylibium sp. T29]|nr:hypothetical protein X551_03493 [Methylibium sp. T29]EWS58087.1 hypothetical protein Y694_03998 [Methylibium sp. T29-B]
MDRRGRRCGRRDRRCGGVGHRPQRTRRRGSGRPRRVGGDLGRQAGTHRDHHTRRDARLAAYAGSPRQRGGLAGGVDQRRDRRFPPHRGAGQRGRSCPARPGAGADVARHGAGRPGTDPCRPRRGRGHAGRGPGERRARPPAADHRRHQQPADQPVPDRGADGACAPRGAAGPAGGRGTAAAPDPRARTRRWRDLGTYRRRRCCGPAGRRDVPTDPRRTARMARRSHRDRVASPPRRNPGAAAARRRQQHARSRAHGRADHRPADAQRPGLRRPAGQRRRSRTGARRPVRARRVRTGPLAGADPAAIGGGAARRLQLCAARGTGCAARAGQAGHRAAPGRTHRGARRPEGRRFGGGLGRRLPRRRRPRSRGAGRPARRRRVRP